MKLRRVPLLVVLSVVVCAVVAAYFVALHVLRNQILEALGPDAELQSLQVRALSIEVTGLRVRASTRGWPAEDELHAARILISPDLRSLLSGEVVVDKIRIEQAVLPMMRTARGMQILPALLAQKHAAKSDAVKADDAAAARVVRLGRIELVDSEIDFFDATVSHKPHRIAVTHLDGHLDNLVLPGLGEEAELDFRGQLPGEGAKAGTVVLRGGLVPSSLDSHVQLGLHDVALSALQPYFVKSADTRVKRGVMKLELDSKVSHRQLHAPGRLQLDHLEIDGDGFAGLSRRAAVGLLADDKQHIDLQFNLDGNLDDPKFSLNEEFYVRVGTALAKSLGVNLGNLGSGAGEVTRELGGAIKNLFGK